MTTKLVHNFSPQIGCEKQSNDVSAQNFLESIFGLSWNIDSLFSYSSVVSSMLYLAGLEDLPFHPLGHETRPALLARNEPRHYATNVFVQGNQLSITVQVFDSRGC